MTRSGLPGRQAPLKSLFLSAQEDLWERNGRFADVVGQLIFSWGETGTRAALAVICWGMCLTGWQWSRALAQRPRRLSWGDAALAVAWASVPHALFSLQRQLNGDTFYFMSGAVNTVVGIIILFAAFTPFIRLASGAETRRGYGWQAVPLLLLAAVFHESAALALVGGGASLWAMKGRLFWSRRLALLSTLAILLGGAHFLLPGVWHRQAIDSVKGRSPLEVLLSTQAGMARYEAPVLAIVIALLGVATLIRIAKSPRPAAFKQAAPFSALVGTFLLWRFTAWMVTSKRVLPLLGGDPSRKSTLTVLSLLFLLLMSVALIVALRSMGRGAPPGSGVSPWTLVILPWAMGMSSLAAGLSAGYAAGRPLAYSTILFAGAALTAMTSLLGPSQATWHVSLSHGIATALALVMLAVGTNNAIRDIRLLRGNHSVWAQVERQIETVRANGRGTVVLPSGMPNWSVGSIYYPAVSIPGNVKQAYKLPSEAKVVYPKGTKIRPYKPPRKHRL